MHKKQRENANHNTFGCWIINCTITMQHHHDHVIHYLIMKRNTLQSVSLTFNKCCDVSFKPKPCPQSFCRTPSPCAGPGPAFPPKLFFEHCLIQSFQLTPCPWHIHPDSPLPCSLTLKHHSQKHDPLTLSPRMSTWNPIPCTLNPEP